jgi:micrococcal nuclease
MRFKALWGVINAIILVVVSYGTFSYLVGVYSVEVDEVSVATYIVDGDTFDVAMGERIRLADVDTPERGQAGYSEASYFLEQLIYGERVYLDVDDAYRYGPYGRLICLVYVDFNSTHYVNVNEALLVGDYARVSDYENEFSPYGWTLFVSKVGSSDRRRLLLMSVTFSLGVTVVINLAVKFMRRGVSSGYRRISGSISRE